MTTGDDWVQLQHTFFFTLFIRQRREYQIVTHNSELTNYIVILLLFLFVVVYIYIYKADHVCLSERMYVCYL